MAKLIICNWKENPATLKEALELAHASDASNVVIAAPFPFLGAVKSVVSKAKLAAQDVFYEASGAFTGAVSASQLYSIGVRYVIVGHSERRRLGDTDAIVSKKIREVIDAGLIPILCVGETKEEHAKGEAKKVIEKQLTKALSELKTSEPFTMLVAYEPVWAISTEKGAKPDTPENAVSMIQYLSQVLHDSLDDTYRKQTVQMIYGGSVNGKNAKAFLGKPEITGALIGGASLKPLEIQDIINSAKVIHNQ